MAYPRAFVVDRDPLTLVRLANELSKSGFQVETLASTIGLTPDLVDLSAPDLLVLDAELPGVDRATLVVLMRSLKARRKLRIVVTTDAEPERIRKQFDVDTVVEREQLLARGAAALGVPMAEADQLDVRALLDQVLGNQPEPRRRKLSIRIDLFSKSNFYAGAGGKWAGIFCATGVLESVGQSVEIKLDLNGRQSFDLEGDVAWQRAHHSFGGRMSTGFGVRLTDVPAPAQESIAAFLGLRDPMFWAG